MKLVAYISYWYFIQLWLARYWYCSPFKPVFFKQLSLTSETSIDQVCAGLANIRSDYDI